MLIVMSSTRTLSIATKCWRKNMMIGAIAGISRMELPWVVVLQILGEDGLMWSAHRWSQNDLSPVRFFQTYWERSTNSVSKILWFCHVMREILTARQKPANSYYCLRSRVFPYLCAMRSSLLNYVLWNWEKVQCILDDASVGILSRDARRCHRQCLHSNMIGIFCTASQVPSRTIQTALHCPVPLIIFLDFSLNGL